MYIFEEYLLSLSYFKLKFGLQILIFSVTAKCWRDGCSEGCFSPPPPPPSIIGIVGNSKKSFSLLDLEFTTPYPILGPHPPSLHPPPPSIRPPMAQQYILKQKVRSQPELNR